VQALAREPVESLGAGALRAVVLPTEYRGSWDVLRRIYSRFAPDVVVHFGLSGKADAIMVERVARRRCDPEKRDAASFAPRSGLAMRSGPEVAAATLSAEAVVAALDEAGFPAAVSDDAGGYVCNATLYRSLAAARDRDTLVGFIHIPPEGRNGLTSERIKQAAVIVLRTASASWGRQLGTAARPA
jgi:pyroglutamyl-peptidase